jgi:predicted transcriptional regulator
MPAAEFRAWMTRNGLSYTAAARALGLSRRMVGYYASGEKPVPLTVKLATRGWEAGRRGAA